MPQPQHRWAELSFRDGEGATVRDGVPGAHLLLQMMSDRLPTAQQAREARREAVRVMRELEENAVEAERGMPSFTDAPPSTTGGPPPAGQRPFGAVDPPVPGTAGPSFDGTSSGTATPSSGGTSSGTTAARNVGEFVGPGEPRGGPPHGGQPAPIGRGGGTPGEIGGFARGVGVGTGPFGGAAQGWSPARTAGAGPGGGFFGGPGAARTDGDEDRDKPLADYLEPEDIFTVDGPVSPPVWGAEGSHG